MRAEKADTVKIQFSALREVCKYSHFGPCKDDDSVTLGNICGHQFKNSRLCSKNECPVVRRLLEAE